MTALGRNERRNLRRVTPVTPSHARSHGKPYSSACKCWEICRVTASNNILRNLSRVTLDKRVTRDTPLDCALRLRHD